jgi:putative FmdB family regulatory protein
VPTYEYRCVSCEHQFERFQRISDEPVKECEVCGAPVKRLLFPVAVHFKGTGFYSTDYAKRNTMGASGSSSGNGSSGVSADSSSASSAVDASSDNGSAKTASTEKSPVGAATTKNE